MRGIVRNVHDTMFDTCCRANLVCVIMYAVCCMIVCCTSAQLLCVAHAAQCMLYEAKAAHQQFSGLPVDGSTPTDAELDAWRIPSDREATDDETVQHRQAKRRRATGAQNAAQSSSPLQSGPL